MDIKKIYIEEFGDVLIGKESDERQAIENGTDEDIFFYVPDSIFEQDNAIVALCVMECIN